MPADIKAQAKNYLKMLIQRGKLDRLDAIEWLQAMGSGKESGFPKAVVSGSPEFVEKEFKAPETLLCVSKTGDPVLQHPSLGEVHGWRGTGKSNFLVGLLRCLALNEDWIAYSCGREGGFKTLYVDGELPAADLQELIELVGCEHGNFSVITGEEQPEGIPSIATVEGQQWLEAAIVEGKFEVVVLDSWSTLGNVPTNDEEFTIPFAAWLKKMRLKGVTIMFGHHDGKGGTQRGHSRLEDFLNWVIQLKWVGEYQGSDGLKCRMKFDKARKPVKGYSDLLIELVDDGAGEVSWVWNFYKKEGTEDKPKGGRKAKDFTQDEEDKLREQLKKSQNVREAERATGVTRGRIQTWINRQRAKPEPKQQKMYDQEDNSKGENSDEPSGF